MSGSLPGVEFIMNYGFIIDNRRCIGCHACTIACKAEHEVPLGNFRTWVKSVEKGAFPNVRRHFTVLRCNHCSDAPCVNICPTRALFHRRDGIVDFDNAHCIGCKACMVACPYDAIYIDVNTRTAAKCNYCAHRVEVGLEPPCVTVCPEQAIIAGDTSDPATRIHSLLLEQPVSVRKPECGTWPKVSYIDGEPAILVPGSAVKAPTYAWAQRLPGEAAADFPTLTETELARVTYDVPHEKPWGLSISSYLWTKSVATGPILVASLLGLLRYVRAPLLFGVFAPSLALALTLVTLVLLIADLRRPARFLKIVFHPNWGSWMVWGADILMAFFTVALLWLGAGFLGLQRISISLLWPGLVSASLAAGYTAFLMAQARGRDLWQSFLLFPHLLIQSFLGGSAALLLGALYFDSGSVLSGFLLRCLLGGLCAHAAIILAEITIPRRSRNIESVMKFMLQGPLAHKFWLGAALAGVVVPINLVAIHIAGSLPGAMLPLLAAASALAGLLVYEDCYVRAGQALPLT